MSWHKVYYYLVTVSCVEAKPTLLDLSLKYSCLLGFRKYGTITINKQEPLRGPICSLF